MFTAFPSIEGFHNVVKMVDNYPHLNPGTLSYKSKVKLHGTNSGVRITKDGVTAQSRTRDITPNDDNMGFAKWVEANKKCFENLRWMLLNDDDCIVVFGEWCGPGIMKGVAVNSIPNRVFAVFSILDVKSGKMIVEPAKILGAFEFELDKISSDIKVLPWYSKMNNFDYSNKTFLQVAADVCNAFVNEVETCDPWVKQEFGVEGVGEGLVFYPFKSDEEFCYLDVFDRFAFKAKGLKHQATKSKEAVQVDPEVLNSINNFVEFFMTEGRVEQGISVVGLDIKNTGKFLQWMLTDVEKESADELEASGLTWDEVKAAVGQEARKKYITECKKI